jgi:hypothetical protein
MLPAQLCHLGSLVKRWSGPKTACDTCGMLELGACQPHLLLIPGVNLGRVVLLNEGPLSPSEVELLKAIGTLMEGSTDLDGPVFDGPVLGGRVLDVRHKNHNSVRLCLSSPSKEAKGAQGSVDISHGRDDDSGLV